MSTKPALAKDQLILFVVKSTPTSGNNVIKPLMLLEYLKVAHHVEVVNCQKDEWFWSINPLKLVPAIQDKVQEDGLRPTVFESSACLRYIADAYDTEGDVSGRGNVERAVVSSWLSMHNAGLGAHAKWWLTLRRHEFASSQDPALDVIMAAIHAQYALLNERLSNPHQEFIALLERPTIADFATLPFANAMVAKIAKIDFEAYPRLKEWSERMLMIEGVAKAFDRVRTFGMKEKCCCNA